jgi:uncharacterized membrane protein
MTQVEETAYSNEPDASSWMSRTLFAVLFALLAALSIAKYATLHTTYYDLGVFLNHFSNFFSGQFWRSFTGHMQPSIAIWSMAYGILPEGWKAIGILVLQAGVLAWPIAPLFRHYGILPALAYGLFFPVWYNALFDFHTDHLAVALLFGFFFLVKSGRIPWAVLLALLLSLVKEPFALQTAACGLFLLLHGKHRTAGAFLMGAGLFYFVVATQYIWPYFTIGPRGGGLGAYSWLGNNLKEILVFVLLKPHTVLLEVFSESAKTGFVLVLFGVLGFIPLLKPGYLVVALPILAISLLSQFQSSYALQNQYTAGLIAPLIMAFAEGLPRAKQIWSRLPFKKTLFSKLVLTGLLICHFIFAPSPFGYTFWYKERSWYHVHSYLPSARDTMIKNALLNHIPPDADIAVSTQNSLNWGHLANRKYYFPFPLGVFQPHRDIRGADRSLSGLWDFIRTGKPNPPAIDETMADFTILDLKRPWYIIDKGCPYEICQNDQEPAIKFFDLVRQAKDTLEVVFEKDEFLILKRVRPPVAEG